MKDQIIDCVKLEDYEEEKRAEAGTPQEPTMIHPTNPAGYGDSGKKHWTTW
jgi:hypothetical protein